MPLTRRRLTGALALTLAMPAVLSRPLRAAAGLRFEPLAESLHEPWSVAFLPDGRFLVTERAGRLWALTPEGKGAARRRVRGLPELFVEGQGGLLDVMVPRDFAASRRLWFTYAEPGGQGGSTALAHARLAEDHASLTGWTRVHSGPGVGGGRHFGARAVEAADGGVWLTTGDRGEGPRAQDVTRPEGKVLRFAADGTPVTVPGVPGAVPGLWSWGHRNIQGAATDAQGRLWTVEHGARGGDELNRPLAGRNYGWPVITHGVDYDGSPIGEGKAKPGMEQPVHYWVPSIAPSGLAILKRPAMGWQGQVLTGSLNSDLIARLDPAAGWAETRIETPETGRVRDVREAPDGSVWFLSVNHGVLFRMTPA
jgi:glucose/arabinose dehydrogenase